MLCFLLSRIELPLFINSSDSIFVIFWLNSKQQTRVSRDPYEVIRAGKTHRSQLSPEALMELAAAHENLGEYAEAIRVCRMTLQKRLSYPDCFFALSYLHFRTKKVDEAKRWFERGLRSKPDPAKDVFFIEQRMKTFLSASEASHWGLWCLKSLHKNSKPTPSTQFELAKLLFERSDYQAAVEHFLPLASNPDFGNEVAQYLSYLYERLYRGKELIEKSLDLAHRAVDRSDLFFNLAMICQHDQSLSELSLHFFYLALESDPSDPGLRFSLEQACLEYIAKNPQPASPSQAYYLMVAHLYQGSSAVAERYASLLRESYGFEGLEALSQLQPPELWNSWLMREGSLFSGAIRRWFGSASTAKAKGISPHPFP